MRFFPGIGDECALRTSFGTLQAFPTRHALAPRVRTPTSLAMALRACAFVAVLRLLVQCKLCSICSTYSISRSHQRWQ